MKKMNRLRLVIVMAVLASAVLVAAAACGDGGGGTGDVREMRVRATDDLRFEPSEMRLRAGEPARLMMENMGISVHDLTIDEMPMRGGGTQGNTHGTDAMLGGEYAMHMAVESHRDGMIEFTPTERGTYTFYCTVEGHREAGMEGRMIVE